MEELIKKFNQLGKNDVSLAGGKGASLGEMTQAGISVPDGFVILSNAFEKFLEETDLNVEIDATLDSVKHEQISTVENASEKIQALIMRAEMPIDIADDIQKYFKNLGAKYVAVRSSATAEDSVSAAWAGQLETYLNTTEEALLENVKNCWASLFTPRAIFYRFEKDLHKQKISVAVVVQRMVESEKSGIAFSVHPVTQDRNQLIIEAGLGLGEAIVSGSITPDSYVVEKEPRRIIDINIAVQTRGLYRATNGGNEWRDILVESGKQEVLSKSEILELSELILKIENHYGFPCDIEWAYENGRFFITQSRPITTLQPSSTSVAKFEKTYERDNTAFVQATWAYALSHDLETRFGIKKSDSAPIILLYITKGSLQIWENKQATGSIQDHLLAKNKTTDFIESVIAEYNTFLEAISQFWKRDALATQTEWNEYSDLLRKAILNFTLIFYTGIDERTPEAVKEKVLKVRETDAFFAENDELVRRSIRSINPELSGYEIFVLPSEIGLLPKKEILEPRANGMFIIDGEELVVEDFESFSEKKKGYRFIKAHSGESLSEIKGQVAYEGSVKGTVRIVKNRNNLASVEIGDIMVSPMTTPDFVPAMEKAAAFITDEGGIMCHAAIIAREMKKPCIIGTKIATDVLRDGDVVEVDAYSGIVSVITKI